MYNVRLKSISLGLLMLTGAVLAMSPLAAAQEQNTALQVTLKPIEGDIQPLVDTKVIDGTVELTVFTSSCTNLAPIEVKLTVAKAPSWASVVLSPNSLFFTPGQGGTSCGSATIKGTQTFKAQVFATQEAPAFQPENIQITATSPSFAGGKSGAGMAETPIKAGYYSILEARVDQPIMIARPQDTVSFPIVVSNFGNALTKVNFVVESSNPEKLIPNQLNPVTIESRLSGKANSATVTLNAITPYHNGYLNEVAAMTVDIKGAYANDPSKTGDAMKINVIVTTKGFYVPGADPSLAILGLAAVAGIAGIGVRRLRQD